ncbi:DMT family transporter [Spirosoma agri]|uniref:EamA family transporter n=1 Tax=Spirosoma agri TaxID=1987381 RepID=A0A6M0IK80_9BACT|nr:DMT family transporter [Spirosoma agri]NEU68716.1 EamA family transporter [Spirosoma agri]
MLLTVVTVTTFAVLIRIVANPLSNVFQKQLTHRAADPLFVISATYGFLALVCLAFWSQLRFAGLPVAFWSCMLVVGLFAMIGNVFLVKALHLGDLSVLGPINAYKSVVGLIVGIFLLNEIPRWWGLVGVLLIVVGSYVVLATKQPQTGFSWRLFQRPEVRLRLAALVFSAIDGAFLKKAIVLSTPTIAFFYWCLFGFGFTIIWIGFTRRERWREQATLLVSQKSTYFALFLTVGVTQVASNIALAGMQVGYALALFQTSALVSVLFGYQFFNEKGILRKLIGAGIMVAGAVMITVLG